MQDLVVCTYELASRGFEVPASARTWGSIASGLKAEGIGLRVRRGLGLLLGYRFKVAFRFGVWSMG